MKTFLYFILTLCVSCGCMFAATNTTKPCVLFAAAFGVWFLFFWGWHRRLKREVREREREIRFLDYMRSNYRRK